MNLTRRYFFSTSAFVLLYSAFIAIIAWPIYQTPFFFVTVSVATVAAFGLAWLSTWRKWSALTVTLAALVALVVLLLPVTNPTALLTGPLTGWLDSMLGIVTSWKQLVTIDLPVGSYATLLTPIFLTVFVSNLIALLLMWRAPRWFAPAVFLLVFASMFGIAFGGIAVMPRTIIGPLNLPIAPGMIAGTVLLVLTIFVLTWQATYRRRQSFMTAHSSSQAITLSGGGIRRLRQYGTAIGLFLVVALGVGWVMSVAGLPSSRDVLRSGIAPKIEALVPVSPLSTYRESFTNNSLYDSDMVTVTSDSEKVGRIRLAVMPYYDGQVFRVVPPGGEDDTGSAFARIPTNLSSMTGASAVAQTSVTINNYSDIWLPSTGDLQNVAFTSDRAADLLSGFYYNRSMGSAIDVAANAPALQSGDSYALTSYVADAPVALSELSSQPNGQLIDQSVVPASMVQWIQAQNQSTSTGSGLQELIHRLRARGYLSHSLTAPTAQENEQVWTAALPGYAFKPSLAGHSTGRLETLFAQLLDKQNNSPENAPDSELVAGIGDDEQFAAAVAVMAQSLGYPARVVVGYHLTAPEDTAYTIAACDQGVCRGQNLSAWVEIQGANGQWATVDVTPQYENPIMPRSEDRQDPKIPTAVEPDTATELPPPAANPENGQADTQESSTGLDLTWLWRVVQVVLLVALIVGVILSPFILIIGSKIHRRRERREEGTTTDRVMAAWEEYVDNSVDSGHSLPIAQTRRELALAYTSASENTVQMTGSDLRADFAVSPGLRLADLADRAAFGPIDMTESEVESSWSIVEDEHALSMATLSWWRKVSMWLSLKSFIRALGPRPIERARHGAFVLAAGQSRRAASGLSSLFSVAGRAITRATRTTVASVNNRTGKSDASNEKTSRKTKP